MVFILMFQNLEKKKKAKIHKMVIAVFWVGDTNLHPL